MKQGGGGINDYLGIDELLIIFGFLTEMEITDIITKVCSLWNSLAKTHFTNVFLQRQFFVNKHHQKIQATRKHLLKREGRDLNRIHVANIEEPHVMFHYFQTWKPKIP